MKKHNEGYALVLVLVVITVLSLVAMAMMAGSLRNLQNQQKSIERMEAKYTAQGEIEKAMAILEKKLKTDDTIVFSQEALNALFGELVDQATASYHKMDKDASGNEYDPFLEFDYILLTLTAKERVWLDDKTEIECTVLCKIKITGNIKTNNTLSISKDGLAWQCVSFTISEGEVKQNET